MAKRYRPEYFKDKEERDALNRRVIHMHVSDDSNFLSPFSVNENPVISAETAEFLNHNIKHNLTDSGVHLVIESDCINQKEEIVYQNAIENYYRIEFKEVWKELRKNAIVSLIMTLFSALVFAVAIVLEQTTNANGVILNMIDVFAWVFLWEAVDLFFLERPQLRHRRNLIEATLQAEITFIGLHATKDCM